jgi:hypothetical protein
MLSLCKIVTFGAGWQIADGDADDVRVCGAHPWQSNYLVFADGQACGTSMCSNPSWIGACARSGRGGDSKKNEIFASRPTTGKKYSSGHLKQNAQGARSDGNYDDVLLRRCA